MKILYFIRGVPTDAERTLAEKLGATFRNRNAWHEKDFKEQCDQVMGDIPPSYEGVPRAQIADTDQAPQPEATVVKKRGRGRPRKTPETRVEEQETKIENAANESA